MDIRKRSGPQIWLRSRLFLVLAVAALTIGPGAQRASAGNLSDGAVSINVSDIDLASTAGQLERDQRVVKIAKPVCDWINPKRGAVACLQRAIGDAYRDCRAGGQQFCRLHLIAARDAPRPPL